MVNPVSIGEAVELYLLASEVPGSTSKFVIAHLVLSPKMNKACKSAAVNVFEMSTPCETSITFVAAEAGATV